MKKFSIEFKWAALATLAALIWMFLEKYLGYHDTKIGSHIGFSLLFNIPLIAIYFLALKEKKKDFYHNVVTWRQIFFTGLVLCIMISLFYPLVQYIIFVQISPDFMDNLVEQYRQHASVSLEEAQSRFSLDIYLRQGVSGNLSTGVVVSAILAYYLQSKKQELKQSPEPKPLKNKYKGQHKHNKKNK